MKTATRFGNIFLLLLLLCACSAQPDMPEETTTGTYHTVGYPTQISFDSYGEMISFLQNVRLQKSWGDYDSYGSKMVEFLERIACGEVQIRIPCLSGEQLALDSRGVCLGWRGMCYFPYQWFFIKTDGVSVGVQVHHLPDEYKNAGDYLTCAQLLARLQPDAPNLHNAEDFASYELIYEQEITYQGTLVTALVKEESECDREYISFLADDLLITLDGEKGAITDEWISQLSFKTVNLEEISAP